MSVHLDHIIIPSRDRAAAARRLAGILGVTWAPATIGPFSAVHVDAGLTIDFDEWTEDFPKGHYCFRTSEAGFDDMLQRMVAAGIAFRSLPHGPDDGTVNTSLGSRIVYWSEPDGHVWELLTESYARADAPGAGARVSAPVHAEALMPPGMTHRAIASAYDQLADRWRDERFSRDNGIAQHRRAVGFLEGAGSGWALNVGCGCNTRFNALLRAEGLDLEGVDISGRMVALAQAADPGVVVHHADICVWEPPRRYRFISAWDSLWHVPLDAQRRVMAKLLSALEPGGVFLFTAGGLDAPGEHWDANMGPSVYYSTLGIPGLLAAIAEADCRLGHLEFDQYPEKHLCVVARKAALPGEP